MLASLTQSYLRAERALSLVVVRTENGAPVRGTKYTHFRLFFDCRDALLYGNQKAVALPPMRYSTRGRYGHSCTRYHSDLSCDHGRNAISGGRRLGPPSTQAPIPVFLFSPSLTYLHTQSSSLRMCAGNKKLFLTEEPVPPNIEKIFARLLQSQTAPLSSSRRCQRWLLRMCNSWFLIS